MPNTTNFNWPTPADTDLVKDGAAAIRNLGNGVDTSLVDLKGGTTGQILSKASNADMDFAFVTPNVGDLTEVQAGTGISVASGTGPIPIVTNTMATEITAKGDLIVGTGSGTFDNLPAGTNGYTLVADSSTATGLAYAAPADGGYTSLASGSLSGALAITSISGAYEDLVLILRDPYPATDESLFFRANNNSTSEAYQWNELANSADATAATYSGTETFMRSQAGNWNNADANCFVIARYYDYANTSSVKNIQISQFYRNDNNTYFIRSFINGYWNDTAAITQVNAYFGNINFSGGTYELFGVK
jgi:hypothetical protein